MICKKCNSKLRNVLPKREDNRLYKCDTCNVFTVLGKEKDAK